VLAGVDLGDDLLEIGAGPGLSTDLLRERVERLTCVEIDPGLAGALADRLAGTNVDVHQGDAAALRFPADRFSAAVSFTMLHHVPTAELQDRIFAELARVVVPGGTVVFNDSVHSDALAAFHRDDTYNPVDPRTLATRLERAGFSEYRVDGNEFAFWVHARV
jgi:ubiquinone/menaquinone biosynthesis C-methylase UbiE